jgi:hypothetical protein
MRSKYLLLLTIISLSNSIFAQESLLWLTPKSAPTNFNNNQYECPLWKDTNGLVDLELLKGNSEWIDLQSIIVRDINGDGYCDIFSGFSSSEEEKIPFLLFLYDSKSGIFKNSSELIENNIGVFDSRKGLLFSCINILTNGVQSISNYSLTITINGEVISITDSAPYNSNSLKNQNGELPSCSGTYETLSQIYADTIQVGTETYRAEFEITNLNTFEMKLIEAIRIGLSAEI